MKLKSLFLGMFILSAVSAGMVSAQSVADLITAGNAAYTTKDYAKAVESYQAAVKADPNSAAAYQGLGNAYYGMGQKADALGAYQKALQLNPGNTQLASFVQTLSAQVSASPAAVSTAPAAASTAPAAAAASEQASSAPVAASASSSASASKFELDFMGGVGACLTTGYDLGFGGGIGAYFPLDKNLSLGGSAAFYTFSVSAAYTLPGISQSFYSIEALASLKYKMDGNGLRPYFFGGAGVSDYTNNSSGSYTLYGVTYTGSGSSSAIYPMAQVGAGLEFPAGTNMGIFVQGKYDILIATGGTLSYVPFEAGLSLNI